MNIITNGHFGRGVSGWTFSTDWIGAAGSDPDTCWRQGDGVDQDMGCFQFMPSGAGGFDLAITQKLRMLGRQRDIPRFMRLRYAIRTYGGAPTRPMTVRIYNEFSANAGGDHGDLYSVSHAHADVTVDTWTKFSARVSIPAWESLWIGFKVREPSVGGYWRLDDVWFDLDEPLVNSCEELEYELRKRRRDVAALKHPPERYREVVLQALADAPPTLWVPSMDTLIATVDDERAYSLANVDSLKEPNQLLRVWLASDDGDQIEIGGWDTRDHGDFLYLYLDRQPPNPDWRLKIEYIRPHDAIDPNDREDVTTLDREWLLSRAMTLLLLEADPTYESAQMIQSDLASWDARRKTREAQIARRHPTAKYRCNVGLFR